MQKSLKWVIRHIWYNCYLPIKSNPKGTRNYIESKQCAASIKDDNQVDIITNTIVAVLKEGIGDTHVIGLSDGAAIHSNDWDHKWQDVILNAFDTI